MAKLQTTWAHALELHEGDKALGVHLANAAPPPAFPAPINGDNGPNTLNGTSGDDTINGYGGNDTINFGQGGNDKVYAGADNDSLTATYNTFTSADKVDGGAGYDTLLITGGGDYYGSQHFNITLNASDFHDIEKLEIKTVDSHLVLSDGVLLNGETLTIQFDDTYSSSKYVSNSVDASALTAGDLVIVGAHHVSGFQGGAGDDSITVRFYFSGANGGDGNDTLILRDGTTGGAVMNDSMFGEDGNDTIIIDTATNEHIFRGAIDGGDGFDTLALSFGTNGASIKVDPQTTISGIERLEFFGDNAGKIVMQDDWLAAGSTLTVSAAGGPVVQFDGHLETDGFFNVLGSDGNDTLTGGALADVINGARGNDVIDGGTGDDALSGGSGNDNMGGGLGGDTLLGGANNDSLFGGSGYDTLIGGAGTDTLSGGANRDSFVFQQASDSASTHFDTITDFDANLDFIQLWFPVAGSVATVDHGALNGATFDHDIATAVGNIHSRHVVLFEPDAGKFSGDAFLVIDANGTAGYQAGTDLVIRLDGALHLDHLTAADFTT